MDTPILQPVAPQQFSIKRVFLASFIGSLSISALAAIFILLVGDFGETEIRVLVTTLTIGGYSLTGLCSSVLYDKGRYVLLSLLGIAVAIVGFLVTTAAIWEVVEFKDEIMWRVIYTCIVLSFSIAHSSLLMLAKSEKAVVNALLSATLFCIAVVAGMLIILIFNEDWIDDMEELYYRLLGVFAVLGVLGTIVVPILRRAKL